MLFYSEQKKQSTSPNQVKSCCHCGENTNSIRNMTLQERYIEGRSFIVATDIIIRLCNSLLNTKPLIAQSMQIFLYAFLSVGF